jgi:energy-coupling factor transporter ATP-binding protein EcfA2
MLKDIRELGKDLKRYFSEITFWPELTFNQKDKSEISKIENVTDVFDHSITIRRDENHCIIPSQYVLYAVFIKEFAVALRDHLDVFDNFKSGKSRNDIGSEIFSGQFDLSPQNLDEWSKSIALKPIVDTEYNFDAKSIINGANGNYKVRGTSDFFTSVILKIINVPDASSSILGKFIYSLCSNTELYNYLEKRFNRNLPYLIKEKKSNRFAYKVISFLFQYDNLGRLKSSIKTNSDVNYKSIKTDELSLTSVFKSSTTLQTNEDLSIGGKLRFFNIPIYLDEDGLYYYFSTEWTSGTNSRLDIDTLVPILKEKYSEFKISQENDNFVFKAIDAPVEKTNIPLSDFKKESVTADILSSGLSYNSELISRFCASLLTKPFVILTGLSGSGKTKLAQAFVQWICQEESQYRIIPVGADWTNREPLLGYPNALKPEEYVKPDSGVIDLILQAIANPELPHFMILDEMNLSHVERYFADFLSVMESKEPIPLYAEGTVENGVPAKLEVPSNLFIIGTVNIDETTNMFSPKVLDRANTIEFRVTEDEMKNFLGNIKSIDMNALMGKGSGMAKSFLEMAESKVFATADIGAINDTLVQFFGELKKTGAEFGYRSATEILRLIHQLTEIDNSLTTNEKIDIAIMQKLLPKLHGSRRKLTPILETLGGFCVSGDLKIVKDVFEKSDFDFKTALFPLSLKKITRMYKGAIDNGFASYAEA